MQEAHQFIANGFSWRKKLVPMKQKSIGIMEMGLFERNTYETIVLENYKNITAERGDSLL